MNRLAFFLPLFLFPALASSQKTLEQQNITIRLFSTQRLDKLTIIPLGSGNSIRIDSQHTIPADKPLIIALSSNEVRLNAEPSFRRQLQLDGAFRFQLIDSSSADASGQWTLRPSHSGIEVLLTTSIEHYVIAAVSGEAAPNEPLESLKAMAVAARTFALTNLGRHASERFDLCDSTHCQALRFGKVRTTVREAVLATTGETLWDRAHRATTFQTQSCGGQAEDAANVWPGKHVHYLTSHPDPYCIRHAPALWHASIDALQLSTIFREQHWPLPPKIEAVQIVKRTSSGRALLLEFQGEGNATTVSASSLRFAIDRHLGWNELRGDWYEVSFHQGTLQFNGRGYGHGVGLCQAGAYEMAKEGHLYRDILGFYFPGTQSRITPTDNGWKTTPHTGWTLTATEAPDAFLAAGDEAWHKANSLFPSQIASHPMVRLMPSTELFRQATDEPGWMLASTRGSDIILQPLSILRAHHAESSTLLHEFLHVLVEQEAAQQTPLWLREGLVEALADPHLIGTSSMSLAAVEAALVHPANISESQRAHAAADQYAALCIQRYGLSTVREWLHTRVPPKLSLPH